MTDLRQSVRCSVVVVFQYSILVPHSRYLGCQGKLASPTQAQAPESPIRIDLWLSKDGGPLVPTCPISIASLLIPARLDGFVLSVS